MFLFDHEVKQSKPKLEVKPDPNFFPLGQFPFDTYCKCFDEYREFCLPFVPSNWEEDLKRGELTRILYWYPVYIDRLFEIAERGFNYLEYLDSYHPKNSLAFISLFDSTNKKLDKLYKSKIKTNVLSELKVKI